MTSSSGHGFVGRDSLTKAELLEILDNSPLVTYCCGPGPQHPTTYISETVTAQLGYRPQNYYDDPSFWTKCIHPDDLDAVLAELDRVSKGECITYEYRMRRADGEYIWLHDEVHPLYARGTGQVRGLVGSWMDVSSLRTAKDALERTAAELETIYRTAPIGLAFVDAELRFLRINEELATINGARVVDHIGQTLRSVIPEIAPKIEPVYRRVLETGKPVQDMEIKGATPAQPDIERFWVTSLSPVHGADGTPFGINVVVSEITNHIKLLSELRKYQHIVSATPDMVSFVDSDYRYQAVNDAYILAHGRPREALIGRHVAEVLGQSVFEKVVKPRIDRCLAGETIRYQEWFEFAGVGKRFTDVSYSRAVDDNGTPRGVAVSVRDMSEQRRVEEQLRESQARLELISNTIEDVVWITDTKSNQVKYASPAYEKIWGQSVESLYRNSQQWNEAIHPDDQPQIHESLARLTRGVTFDEEYRITRPDGSQRWIRDRGYPIIDDQGRTVHVVGIAQDITDRKRAEEMRSRLEAELRQAQKMQAVGQLAAGLAHDINSVLMIILGNAELLQSALAKSRVGKSTKIRSGIENITCAVDRGKDLIDQLLCLGRSQAHRPQPTNLNRALKDVEGIVRPLLGKSIQLDMHYANDLPPCDLDSAQFLRAVVNLVINARDAMPDGGTISIETATASHGEGYNSHSAQTGKRKYVTLTVSDTGTGMQPDVIERIFEPFFSTKPVGQGSGLGLSVVHGIMEQHKGHTRVESTPGRGTTFRLFFPALE